MALNTQWPKSGDDTPLDRPRVERTEHANLRRPGAQFHPAASLRAAFSWQRVSTPLASRWAVAAAAR